MPSAHARELIMSIFVCNFIVIYFSSYLCCGQIFRTKSELKTCSYFKSGIYKVLLMVVVLLLLLFCDVVCCLLLFCDVYIHCLRV